MALKNCLWGWFKSIILWSMVVSVFILSYTASRIKNGSSKFCPQFKCDPKNLDLPSMWQKILLFMNNGINWFRVFIPESWNLFIFNSAQSNFGLKLFCIVFVSVRWCLYMKLVVYFYTTQNTMTKPIEMNSILTYWHGWIIYLQNQVHTSMSLNP
jgi:hypothetical protein